MCVLFVGWRVVEGAPIVVAANRDEAFGRPTTAAHRWDDCPQVVGGRDGVAGGTWLGAAMGGRWASVTNIRHPRWMHADMPRSRGHLVSEFLCGAERPEHYAAVVAADREGFGGFNLLLGDRDALYYLHREDEEPRRLEPGIYGLSNARLDDPWPKVARGGRAFRRWLESGLGEEEGLRLLRDHEPAPDELLPDTGVGIELERRLSPLFIVGDEYGTRSSTLLIIAEDGSCRLVERTYGPGGRAGATVRQEWSAAT